MLQLVGVNGRDELDHDGAENTRLSLAPARR
jgi:hypothetical protein